MQMKKEKHRYNLLIAEDHTFVRKGTIRLLQGDDLWENIYEAENGLQALEICGTTTIDLILLDIRMPGLNGIETVKEIKKFDAPRPRILILSQYDETSLVLNLLELGVHGFLHKSTSPNEVLDAMRAIVVDGTLVFPPRYAREIEKQLHSGAPRINFSPKDLDLVALLAKGLTNNEIATQLKSSVRTIEAKRAALEKAMHVKTTAQLIDLCHRSGIMPHDPALPEVSISWWPVFA